MRRSLVFMLLGMVAFPSNAEILNCSMNQIEIANGQTLKVIREPILSTDNKPITHYLVIAGLGTEQVSAKAPIYSLASGPRIYPMLIKEDISGDENDWYYTKTEQGVTVLQIPKKGRPFITVKLYNLGAVPYTYVGSCK